MDTEGSAEAQPDPVPGWVRAAAAGLDLTAVLADSAAPAPHYRFRTLASHAASLSADVRALGSALLAALEKREQ